MVRDSKRFVELEEKYHRARREDDDNALIEVLTEAPELYGEPIRKQLHRLTEKTAPSSSYVMNTPIPSTPHRSF